jgi:hypothetical protein
MKAPELIITKEDLDDTPYLDMELPEGEFDVMEVVIENGNKSNDIAWFIAHCKKAQTQEWYEFLKFIKPNPEDISYIIALVEELQTDEWFSYYKSLKPDYKDVSWLLMHCRKTETPEWYEYFKSLNPDEYYWRCLLAHHKGAREYFENEPEIIRIWTQRQN